MDPNEERERYGKPLERRRLGDLRDRPSEDRLIYVIDEARQELVFMMEVPGLGILTMRCASETSDDGKIEFKGVALFTESELKYGL